MQLAERDEKILFHVIDEFIRSGEAVPSSLIAKKEAVSVSSATVRNVMAALEEGGYLVQPHTSAGRVPTAQGMRSYVDLLSRHGEPGAQALELADLTDELPPIDSRAQARWAGAVLTDLSEMASLVLGPDPNAARIRDVRLVSLGPRKVLAIFVEQDGGTVEQVTAFEQPIDPTDLIPMQNYLTDLGRGRTLAQLRERVRAELTETRGSYHRFMTQALAVAHGVGQDHRSDLHVEGAFKFVELGELARVGEILRALEEKERVIAILDDVCEARQPVVIIGPEAGWELADELAFVLCGFYRGTDRAGLVGVLGPMRMNYARVIPLVDQVARVLSTELDSNA